MESFFEDLVGIMFSPVTAILLIYTPIKVKMCLITHKPNVSNIISIINVHEILTKIKSVTFV